MSAGIHDTVALAQEAKGPPTPDRAALEPDSPGNSDTAAGTPIPTALPPLQRGRTIASSAAGRPYSAFTKGQKWFIVTSAALVSVFSPISSNIYVPAIPTLAEAFQTSESRINLTVTIYLVFQALSPSFWGSAADCLGRRPVFIICLLIYLLSCVGTALCPTNAYWLLMLMRVVQSIGGSATIAIGTGVVADIATPAERGKYLGIFNMTNTFGPAIGPLLGGVFAGTLGWRSIFWFLTIFCAASLVNLICFFPETLRSLVGDGSLPPPILNCTPAALVRHRHEKLEMAERGEGQVVALHRTKFKPWASFVIAFEPDVILLFMWSSMYYAMWYAVLTLFSTLLKKEYGASDILIGLSYIPNGAATGIASITVGRIADKIYRKEQARVGGDHRKYPQEFRLERTRFILLPYLAGLSIVSTVALGWSMAAHAPVAVPIVLQFFIGLGTGMLNVTTIYGIDLFPGQGGAVTATFNLTRCMMGAIAVAVIQQINNAMGPGWTFVLIAGLCLLATPLPLIVLRIGPKRRLQRWERAKRKEEERKKREREELEQLTRVAEAEPPDPNGSSAKETDGGRS